MADGTGAPVCKTTRCTNPGPLVRGWCDTCYTWSKRHDGADPANRSGLRRVPESCIVVEDGERCPEPVRNRLRSLCGKHDSRRRKHGNPLMKTRRATGELQAFLLEAAHATTDECLVVEGRSGRPSTRQNGETMSAARAVWTMRHGDPGKAFVLHRCNGGSGSNGCVNIRHLYLGDDAQNSRDKVENERSSRGEDRPDAKLTEDDVRAIRRRYIPRVVTQQVLADEYGVDQTTISEIIRRKKWAWLD